MRHHMDLKINLLGVGRLPVGALGYCHRQTASALGYCHRQTASALGYCHRQTASALGYCHNDQEYLLAKLQSRVHLPKRLANNC